MARAKRPSNGRLEEALTNLLQTQVMLSQTQAAALAQIAESNRRMDEWERITAERFARIEAILIEHGRILAEHSSILAEHGRILADHTRILQALSDAIREKIGFKASEPARPTG